MYIFLGAMETAGSVSRRLVGDGASMPLAE